MALAERFSKLTAKLADEDFEDALEVADELLSLAPDSDDLLRTRILCLIHCSSFQEAVDEIEANQSLGMGLERAYALYSMHRSSDALEAIAKLDPTPAAQQLEAQTRYRIGDYDGAAEIYEQLRNGGSSGSDFCANVLAAFSVSSRAAEGAVLFRELAADTYEGVYNGACAQIHAGQLDEARDTLMAAHKMGKEQLEMDDYTGEEIADELSVVDVQLAYVNHLQGNQAASMETYMSVIHDKPGDAAVLAVARNNVVACKGERDLFDGFKHMRSAASTEERKLNKQQQQVIGTNNALVLLFMGKNKECREAIDKLNNSFPDSENVAVLYAALAYRQKSFKKCEDLLKASASSKGEDCTMVLLTLAQFYANQRKFPEAAATLSSISELQHEPATVATLVGLCDQLNDKAGAIATLDNAVKHWKQQKEQAAKLSTLLKECAAYKLRRGMSAEALKTYGELIELQPDDHVAVASAIVAAAYCDPTLAKQYQRMLPPLTSAEGFDGEELEASVAPRISRKKGKGATEDSKGGVDNNFPDGVGEDQAATEEAKRLKKKKKKKKIRCEVGIGYGADDFLG